jgi:hypothetical protein
MCIVVTVDLVKGRQPLRGYGTPTVTSLTGRPEPPGGPRLPPLSLLLATIPVACLAAADSCPAFRPTVCRAVHSEGPSSTGVVEGPLVVPARRITLAVTPRKQLDRCGSAV